MRLSFLIFAAATIAIVACGSDKATGTNGGGTTPTTTYVVAFDSGIVDTNFHVVGSSLTAHLHVTNAGVPAPNATVQWSVTTGHGTVSAASSTTDASGAASVVWTLGDTIGSQTLAAVSNGAASSLTTTASSGPAGRLGRLTPDSVTIVAGASALITARAFDQFGNPASNVTVAWTATAGSLSAAASTSGVSGNLDIVYTTPSTPGTYFVTATLPGKASVTFRIIVI